METIVNKIIKEVHRIFHKLQVVKSYKNIEYNIKDSICTASISESKTDNKELPTNLYNESSEICQEQQMCKNLKLEIV